MNKNTESGYKKIKWRFGKEIEIPEEWDCCTLQKLCCKLKSGGTPKSDQNEYYDGDIPFASIKDITSSEKYLTKTIKTITKKGLVNSNAWIIPKNSLLYSMYATVGKPIINKIDTTTHQGILGILVDEKKLNNEFLYYVLRYIQPILIRYFLTNTQSNINLEISKNLEILHPKKTYEQQKIASILSGVDALIESTQKVIEKTERLKKGVMQYLLTTGIGSTKFKKVKWYHEKEIKIPNRWKWSELGKEGSLSSGATPRRDHPEYYDGDILWVSSGELDYNFITTTAETINVLGLQKTNLKIHSKGTFLFAITGLEAKGTRGRCAILGTEATTNQSCMAFYDSNSLDTKFLFYYFLTFGEKIIFAIAQGTKQQSLNLELSKKIKVPIPPFTEQQKIASILSGVDAYIQKNQQYKERLEKLKKGLMQKLLTGQIRVKV